MRYKAITLGALVLGAGALQPAHAASDVSNTPTLSNKATGSVAASIASSQASTIISTAATGGFTAGTGGFSAGGAGGFGAGGTGGFSGGGTGGTGGFSGGAGAGNGGTGGSGTNGPNRPQAMNFRLNGGGESGGDGPSRNGVWAQALWADVDKTEKYLNMHGNVYNVMGGFDHRFNDRVLAGLAFGYENVDFTTTFNTGKYKDEGETLSPYLAFTLSRNWTVDGAVSYSWLSYDSRRTDTSGSVFSSSFKGNRFAASGTMTGNFVVGENWRLQSKTQLLYSFEHQDSYVESSLAAVDANAFALGRLSTGGKFGYDINGVLPYVKAMAEWDFRTPPAVLKINQQLSEVDHGGGVLGLGVELNRGPLSGSIEADYNSLGRQDLSVWALIGRFRWEF